MHLETCELKLQVRHGTVKTEYRAMGGHAAGDVASRMVVDSLASLGAQSSSEAMIVAVDNRLREVNQRLRVAASKDYQNRVIGSTVVVLGVFDDVAICLWVGDSRAYLFRNQQLQCFTKDQTVVQLLIDNGEITPEEAAAKLFERFSMF